MDYGPLMIPLPKSVCVLFEAIYTHAVPASLYNHLYAACKRKPKSGTPPNCALYVSNTDGRGESKGVCVVCVCMCVCVCVVCVCVCVRACVPVCVCVSVISRHVFLFSFERLLVVTFSWLMLHYLTRYHTLTPP